MSVALFFLPQPLPSRATVGAVAALLAACMLAFHYANPAPMPLAVGLTLITLGIAIRLATNATLRKNELVCREGLYAACRHPMYVGTLIAATGIAVALNHPVAFALLAVALAISLHRARKEEEFLLAKFPDYAAYRSATPPLPTPASVMRALAGGRWPALSLRQCFLNGEVLRLNFYVLLLVAAGYYLQMPHAAIAAGAAISVLLAALSVALHPAEAPRSRGDYVLPGVLGIAALAALVLA